MQISIFLPLILMAGTGGDGADAASIVTRASAQANEQANEQTSANSSTMASTMASTTISSPANIMPNSHFRSQSGFQNDAQSGLQANTQVSPQASLRADAMPQGIFEGCRPAVLDPRLSSRILFDNRLAVLEGEYGASEATSRDQIFIAHCGDEFVLFSRVSAGPGEVQDALYLRFEDGTFQLVDQHWG